MTEKRKDILDFLAGYLQIEGVRDYGPQGLQVEGKDRVSKIVTGVSCSIEFFGRAIDAGADMIIVHHGLLWDRDPRRVTGVFKRRLKLLLDHDINLAAYHLPLDAHQEIGHSARIGVSLGLLDQSPFGEYQGMLLGVRGRFDPALTIKELSEKLEKLFGQTPLLFPFGPSKISSLAVCSGGGADMVAQAVAGGIDCFISGEAREQTQAYCKETGINFIAAGHYNTEKPGIIALGDLLAEKFAVKVEFIDIPNPV